MFGVEDLYASQRSLAERGLSDAELNLAVERLDDSALTTLLDRYDQVITPNGHPAHTFPFAVRR